MKRLRFGAFEIDATTGELFKQGALVRLQPQPFRVLQLLVSNAGELVSHEQIRKEIWGDETFVDFEHSIHFCINQIRLALSDQASSPRFIETVPKRGYRFVGQVQATQTQSPGRAEVPRPAPPTSWRWLVAAALVAGLAGLAAWQAGRAAPPLRLAVLPFAELGKATSQEYFEDGLTEDLIAELGRSGTGRLAVIARTTSMRYKGSDVATIGRELRADYVLEGTVRQAGERMRITAKLVRVSDRLQVWSDSYDRPTMDVLDVQADVARRVARGIGVQLGTQPAAARSVDPETYRVYLQGRFLWNRRTDESLRRGLGLFQEAALRDPSFALAHVGIAESHLVLAHAGLVPGSAALPPAEEAARRALALEPDRAEALTALAAVQHYSWRWRDAERTFRLAIAVNPSHVTARQWYSILLRCQGRFVEAIAEARAAVDADPLSLIANANLSVTLFRAGRIEEASRQATSTITLDPNFGPAYVGMGLILDAQGRYSEALHAYERAVALVGDESPAYMATVAQAQALHGDRGAGEAAFAALIERRRDRHIPPYDLAMLAGALGRFDEAFGFLREAEHTRDFGMVFLAVDPRAAPMHRDPRFSQFLGEVGLPASPLAPS